MMERAHPISGRSGTIQPAPSRFSAPPLSREHGAWVMLYTPVLIVLLAGPAPTLLPCLLLVIAATSAFCLQHAAGIMS
jgi:YwiC-like protein